MTAFRRLSPALSALLLSAALVLRLVVPSGWMPIAGAGELRLAICTGGAPATLVLHSGAREHDQPGKTGRDPCPFAVATGGALDLPVPPGLPAIIRSMAGNAHFAQLAATITVRRAPRPPARGPPLLA
jgi:hypothetical protein